MNSAQALCSVAGLCTKHALKAHHFLPKLMAKSSMRRGMAATCQRYAPPAPRATSGLQRNSTAARVGARLRCRWPGRKQHRC
jgi:hypothetical protein